VSPIAAPDPEWWTENINYVDTEVHQECPITRASVFEPPLAIEVGMDSLSAVFQLAFSQSGFSQQLFDFNAPPPHDIDVGQEALEAFPDSANRMTVQNSMSSTHIDWNSTTSSSTSRSDCDSSRTTIKVSKPLGNETFGQESQQEHKSLISALRSFPCPHCPRFFKSEELLGYTSLLTYRYSLLKILDLTIKYPTGISATIAGSVLPSSKI
jgi:hypothetical protein